MSLPRITSREDWLEARRELLEKEKVFTRERDALSVERRNLPMVKIEKDYRFEGPDGEVTLLDMFEGRSQLIVGHFMFNPEWEDGCPSCSAGAAELSDGLLEHLRIRDTSFAYVSRAPIEKIERYQEKRAGLRLVLVLRQRLQLRLQGHGRRDGGARGVQLKDEGRARGRRDGLLLRCRAADRAARVELLPARRRRGIPHLLDLRPRRREPRRLLLLARPHRLRYYRSMSSMRRAIGIVRISEVGDRKKEGRLQSDKDQGERIRGDCRDGLKLIELLEEPDVSGVMFRLSSGVPCIRPSVRSRGAKRR